MHGNVDEWCEDDWHGDYKGAPTNGSSWNDTPRGKKRVLRGGSFNYVSWLARCAFRSRDYPGDWSVYYGFRVVASPFFPL